MLKEKAGALAGQIWSALNETEGLTQKQIKKAAKMKADKDFFLGLGWLLREDKVEVSEVEGEIFVKLVYARIITIKNALVHPIGCWPTHFFYIFAPK